MSIFKDRTGICDWCSADGIGLIDYNDMKVCEGCHQELTDHDNPVLISLEEQYQELIEIFNRSGG